MIDNYSRRIFPTAYILFVLYFFIRLFPKNILNLIEHLLIKIPGTMPLKESFQYIITIILSLNKDLDLLLIVDSNSLTST